MNQIMKEMCIAGLLGLVLPGIVLAAATQFTDQETPVRQTVPTQTQQATVPEKQMRIPVKTHSGSIAEMEMGDYLTGVVLAEMPASFEEEALKAQAVVARTYAVRGMEKGTKHPDAAVCTDSSCCQGYVSEADYAVQGGTGENISRVRSAVAATENHVLTYAGELIEATYFSCSGGSTEDAVAVWGTDVPYLQAVASPGEENAAHYSDTVTFKPQEFASALGLKLQGNPQNWLGEITYTDGGGVETVVIGGVTYKGTTVRSALGLRSTAFSVTTRDDSVTVTTKGYGHRVGMSQYGADAMAATGCTYDQILSYYYTGAELTRWID